VPSLVGINLDVFAKSPMQTIGWGYSYAGLPPRAQLHTDT
jgi:hypothetical protein